MKIEKNTHDFHNEVMGEGDLPKENITLECLIIKNAIPPTTLGL